MLLLLLVDTLLPRPSALGMEALVLVSVLLLPAALLELSAKGLALALTLDLALLCGAVLSHHVGKKSAANGATCALATASSCFPTHWISVSFPASTEEMRSTSKVKKGGSTT